MTNSRAEADRRRFLRQEYVARINRVMDHVEANLDGDLSLKTLAGVAGFSPFHFHRLFSGITGETLNRFIQRIRLEKAAAQLMANRRKTITEIALDCGFSSSASFARAFRDAFGMSATQWRNRTGSPQRKQSEKESKTGKTKGKTGKERNNGPDYLGDAYQPETRRSEMQGRADIKAEVKVETMPEMEVAYVRHIGPYAGDGELFAGLIHKLMAWAGPRGLLGRPEAKLMSVYHDDPNLTEADKLRTSICLTVPPETEAQGEVGRMALPGGKCAVARFELAEDGFTAAWDSVYGGWLPESGYQPDDRPPFEIHLNNPREHPEGLHLIEICVPVKPM